MAKDSNELVINGESIALGECKKLELELPPLLGQVGISMPVLVCRSKKAGPRLFITSGIHGDEIIGIDVIAKLLKSDVLSKLYCGDVVIIPVVNMYGFLLQQRYMPDRRDLNRSFPGGENGSLAAVLAKFLTQEIISKCTHGIDFHSGAEDHANLAQIRIDMRNQECIDMARAFCPKLIVKSENLEGSFRKYCKENDIPILLFEGSEAHRFDDEAAKTGYEGIIHVMEHLGMIHEKDNPCKKEETFISDESHWQRAPEGGIFRSTCTIGQKVKEGDVLGNITDLFGNEKAELRSSYAGLVIGINMIPTVSKGDALYHIAISE